MIQAQLPPIKLLHIELTSFLLYYILCPKRFFVTEMVKNEENEENKSKVKK